MQGTKSTRARETHNLAHSFERELPYFFVLYFIFSCTVIINKARRITSFKFLEINCKEIAQLIWKSQMSASSSNISTCYPAQLVLFKNWIYYRCFERKYLENIQASTTDLWGEISELFRTAILKNNRGQLLHYCFFYQVQLID